MKQWYTVSYRDARGELNTMMCRGSTAGEALRDAAERLDRGDEILGAISEGPVYPKTYENQTIDGMPRRATR